MPDQKDDPLRPVRDKRGFFMLPRSPMESGYYNYGRLDGAPDRGAYQYPHPIMMQAILRVGLEWQAIDKRRFGVGNISLADGPKHRDHKKHRNGLQADLRALRKLRVDWVNMQKLMLLALVAVCQLASAAPSEKKQHELNRWNPLQAEYKIHSGGTAYSELPTKNDSALTISFKGEAAKQLFDQIGPDVKDNCGASDPGDRERRKKGALCLYETRLDSPTDSHYRCWIGINLRSGEGDVRVSC